jgi:hypothetical protein
MFAWTNLPKSAGLKSQIMKPTPFHIMPKILALATACAAASATSPAPADAAPPPPENFPLAPESERRADGVAPGETLAFEWNDSQIFPGTRRKIRVYVPAAYTAEKPACTAVFQDGGGYRFETVFDNLIAAGEMPVTIAVIVPPGNVPGAVDPSGVRHNRTFEYDSPGDRYARFLLDEILPAAEKLATADGRPVRLSRDGNDRMIAGGSSGAAAAFNAAWAMPHEFSRVCSGIGSYTGLRGSHIYPTLIHKTEPKPLRLFLQSGTHDMWTSFGDWWSANNAMVRALEFAGYEFAHAFADGRHSPAHMTALFPDAMRFLWKNWPARVGPGGKIITTENKNTGAGAANTGAATALAPASPASPESPESFASPPSSAGTATTGTATAAVAAGIIHHAAAASRNQAIKHTIYQDRPWQLLGELPRDHEWQAPNRGFKIRADKDGRIWAAVGYIIRPDIPPDTILVGHDPRGRATLFTRTYRHAADGTWEQKEQDERLLAFDKDGVSRLVIVSGTNPAAAYTPNQTPIARREDYIERIAPDGTRARLNHGRHNRGHWGSLVVTPRGDIYAAQTFGDTIMLFHESAEAKEAKKGASLDVKRGAGYGQLILALTGDGDWLAAFEHGTTRGQSFRVETDGALAHGQSFYVLHKPDAADGAGALDAAAEASKNGYLYAATTLGVQILDANGRTAAILPLPGEVAAISLCFAGPDFKTLHALGADGKIYTRPVKNPGAHPWLPPVPIKIGAG